MTGGKQPISTRLKTSIYLAFAGGLLTPLLETIRRWHQLTDLRYFVHWFDDYVIGGFLFFAAWKTLRSVANGRKYLIASWGVALGMGFYSFANQLQSISQPDPAPVSSLMVAIIKGIMFSLCILSLVLVLRDRVPEDKS